MKRQEISDEHIKLLTLRLKGYLIAGVLADCYAVIKDLSYENMERVTLLAGFSAIASRNVNEKKSHITSQISFACGLKMDGYEVRRVRDAGAFLE